MSLAGTEAGAGKRSALIVTTLSSFLTPLALSTVNVALPSIGREFHLTAVALGWIATSYILTAAMVLLPFGRAGDIYGRKRIFIAGTVVFTIASFLLGLASSQAALVALRALQGVGAGMIFGTAIAILTSVFPIGERGKVLGINVAAVYLGLSFGPFVGGILTQHFGWRSVFFVNVPPGILIVLLTVWKLRQEWAEAKGEAFDLPGSAVYLFTVFALMYGFSLMPTGKGVLFLAAGLAGLGLFVLRERRCEKPLLDVALFANNRVFVLSNAAALIHYSATFAVSFLLSFYLQHIRGLTPQEAGLVLVCQPFVQALFSPLAGRISDRVEPRIIASTGMGLTALGLFLLTSLSARASFAFIVISLIILGIGFALFSSPNTNAIMSAVKSRHYGIASSMLATMRLLGQMMSMAIAMITFSLFMGGAELAPALYPLLLESIRVALGVFGILCVAGIFASMTRGNLRGGNLLSETPAADGEKK
jgi:EmrB/QacA subfamily drug resistance transporter